MKAEPAWLRGAARSMRWVTYVLAGAVLLTLLAFGGCVAYGQWLQREENRCLERLGLEERPEGDAQNICDPTP